MPRVRPRALPAGGSLLVRGRPYFFAPCLLALCIRGAKAHSDQTPDRVETGGAAWLQAAPLINRLLPSQFKSKTDDRTLPNPRSAALFSCYDLCSTCRVLQYSSHLSYYENYETALGRQTRSLSVSVSEACETPACAGPKRNSYKRRRQPQFRYSQRQNARFGSQSLLANFQYPFWCHKQGQRRSRCLKMGARPIRGHSIPEPPHCRRSTVDPEALASRVCATLRRSGPAICDASVVALILAIFRQEHLRWLAAVPFALRSKSFPSLSVQIFSVGLLGAPLGYRLLARGPPKKREGRTGLNL
jgi:hypothetical protein